MSNNNQKLEIDGLEIKKLKDEVLRLKQELKKKKKYGLVWEEKPEEVVEMCKEKLPVLKEVKGRAIITDKNKPVNLLIEGDNYHALSVLNYTHKGKIDVIYIDPPYNTGNKDFIFNDHYIDKEDSYRHSKWLSFMEKRLKLAKNLLKDTGVIFISIDDNEVAQLKLLLDSPDLFGENNFIANIPRRTKSAGKTTETVASNHDYIVIYSKDRQKVKFGSISIDDSAYKHKDEYYSERGAYTLSQTLDYDSLSYSASLDYELKLNNQIHYPCGDKKVFLERKAGKHRASDWTWRWSKELVDFGNKQGFIVVKKGKNGKPRIYTKTYFKVAIEKVNGKYTIISIDRTKNFSTLDLIESLYSNDVSKKDIRSIFGNYAEFAYPKPLSLLKYLINTIPNQKSIVLDFFAGSGTTGHAVLELNKEDGGNRKFILCTNNENKICEEVTYPRLEKVIKGYNKNGNGEQVVGLGGNLKYLKTDFVDFKEPTDANKIKLTKQAVEMLCVKEGAFEPVIDKNDFKLFKNANHYMGIIFEKTAILAFKKAINGLQGEFNVYVFSLGDEDFSDEFSNLEQKVNVSAIPEAILKVYRRIFK